MSSTPEEAEQERTLRHAVALARRRLIFRNRHVSLALNELAYWLLEKRRYAEAEPLYREALALERQSRPSGHLANRLNNLGYSLYLQSKFAEAEPLLVESVHLARRLLPPASEDIGWAYSPLISLYLATAQFTQAEQLARELVETYRRVLTVPHSRFIAALYSLGTVCRILGNYVEAKALLDEAHEKAPSVRPKDETMPIKILCELGRLQVENENFRAAEDCHQEALNLCEKFMTSPIRSMCYSELAVIEYWQGNYERAAEYILKSIEIDKANKRQETRSHAVHLTNMAAISHKMWRNEEAESLLRQAIEIDRKTLPAQSIVHGERLETLAVISQEQERYSEAEALLKKALTLYRRAYPAAHRRIRTLLSLLADCYAEQGKYIEAEPLLREAITISYALADHASNRGLIIQLRDLAHLYHDAGWYDKAEQIYREAMERMMEELGDDHSETQAIAKDRIQFDLDRRMAKEEEDESPF